MVKVARLGWTTGFSLKQYGARLGLRSNSEQALGRARALLLPSWQPLHLGPVDTILSLWEAPPSKLKNAKGSHLLYWNAARTVRSLNPTEVFAGLEELIDVCLATYARKRYCLQAGVVEWRGKALLLPGASLSGKSTLVRALENEGQRVYSDQFAVVDAQGRVHPYLRPSADLRTALRKSSKPLVISTILFSTYKVGASFAPKRMTHGLSALELIGHALSVSYRPKEVLPVIARIASQANCYKGRRGEAGLAVRRILSLI